MLNTQDLRRALRNDRSFQSLLPDDQLALLPYLESAVSFFKDQLQVKINMKTYWELKLAFIHHCIDLGILKDRWFIGTHTHNIEAMRRQFTSLLNQADTITSIGGIERDTFQLIFWGYPHLITAYTSGTLTLELILKEHPYSVLSIF